MTLSLIPEQVFFPLIYIYPSKTSLAIHRSIKNQSNLFHYLINSRITSCSILLSQRLPSSNIKIMSEGNHRDAPLVCPELDIYQFGYPRCDTADSMASSSNDSPFLCTYDDLSVLESGLYQQKYGDMSYRNQDKAWESIDSRFLMLLGFFRELFFRRREVFKKLFPELHDEFLGMFKKIGNINLYVEKPCEFKTRALCLQRSLSVGSPRTPSRNGGESPLRLERFKVRTVVPGGGGQGDRGASN